eukprot:4620973-Amphidinium_carterae.1
MDGKQHVPQNGAEERVMKGIVSVQGIKSTVVTHVVRQWAVTENVEVGHLNAYLRSGAVMFLQHKCVMYFGSGLQLGKKHLLTALHCLGDAITEAYQARGELDTHVSIPTQSRKMDVVVGGDAAIREHRKIKQVEIIRADKIDGVVLVEFEEDSKLPAPATRAE